MNQDQKWIKKCLDNPEKYKIFVDNDMVFVAKVTSEEWDGDTAYTFDTFGEDFIVTLLEYLGGNVEYV